MMAAVVGPVRFAPLIFFQLYWTGVAALFFFGPWPWKIDFPWTVAIYLVAIQVSIALGYFLAVPAPGETTRVVDARTFGLRFAKWSIIIAAALAVPTSLARTGHWYPDLLSGVLAPGRVYNENFARLALGNDFIVAEYCRFVAAPFLSGLFPLSVVYWSKLGMAWKVAASLTICFSLAIYIASGQNKGIADFISLLPFLATIGITLRTFTLKIPRWAGVGLMVAALVGFFAFFGATQLQRGGEVGSRGVFAYGGTFIYADKNHPISRSLPPSARVIFESFSRYLTQGYQALAFTLPYEQPSTLGLGNSMFTARNADRFFLTTFFSKESLPSRLEAQTGWPVFGLWHSIYPWLASDVGWNGTILLMGGFGFLLGLCWNRSLDGGDPLYIIMTSLMVILFMYAPNNNQILQSGETWFAFFITLCLIAGRGLLRNQATAA